MSYTTTPGYQQDQYSAYGQPPAPPPKSVSERGPPLPPTPAFEVSELSADQAPSLPTRGYAAPTIEATWLPESLKDKSTQDLDNVLRDASLQAALLSNPSTGHPAGFATEAAIEPIVNANVNLAAQVEALGNRVAAQRAATQSRLLSLRALEQQYRSKLAETEDALNPFSPKALYQKLNASATEQEQLLRGMEESWLEEPGEASDRETTDMVKRVKEASRSAFLKKERKARWDEGRVGGWNHQQDKTSYNAGMPSRKSNVSVVSNSVADDTNIETAPAQSKGSRDGVSIDDLTLPKSMIARLAKGVLPANTQIHKDALLALHKSATVFVSYIASNANELAQAGGKKTIAPAEVFAAIKDAELEAFVPRLEAELKKYNEMQCDKRNSYRHRVKQEKAAASQQADDLPLADESLLTNGDVMDTDDRPQKKQKGLDGDALLPMDDDELIDAQLNAEEAAAAEAAEDEDDIDDDELEDEDDDEEELPDEPLMPEPIHDEALDEPDSD